MISVITCPRQNGVKYLYSLLDAIDACVPKERLFLFCDGNDEIRSGWQIERLEPKWIGRRDNKYIGWKTIEKAASIGEDLLFFEDDILPLDSTAIGDAVHHVVPAACGYTSFHRSRWTRPGGIWPSGVFTHSQAVKIPVRSFPHLLDWYRRCSGDWDAIEGFDSALQWAGHNARWLFEQTERNYFDHIGEVSAVHNGADGRSIAL